MTDPTPQVPEVTSAVRAAMAALDDIEGRPLAEHVEAFERVHVVLGEALADQGTA